jgi:hypothetical protein
MVALKRSAVAVEALALALLTALPVLAYFVYLFHHPIERFAVSGDYAGLELATRYVPSGRTLLGPYSRFGFSHPGPLYFYVLAPVYALCGSTSTGLFAGACTVNTVSVMTIVGAVRLATTRVHAVAVALVILGWLGAFGDVCAMPWNPLVVVLPLTAFLVLATLVTNGAWRAIPFAVLAGAFAAETHLSTVPAIVGITVATCAIVLVRVRHGHPMGRTGKVQAIAGLAVLGLALAPPLLEELITPNGNITKLARFFAARREPMRPLSAALLDWASAAAWLPDRLSSGTVMNELYPEVMRSDPPQGHLTVIAGRWLAVLVVLSAAAIALAWRRRDATSGSFLGLGVVMSVLSAFALRAIVGVNYIYLLFWTTAGVTVIWMGIVATFATALADVVGRSRARATLARVSWAVALVVMLATSLRVSALQRSYLARETLRPAVDTTERDAYAAVRARLAQTGETPVFHAHGAWHYGLAFLLEASKDHMDARIVDRERWILGRQTPGAEGVAHPLHVYVDTPDARVFVRGFLDKLATVGFIVIYTSPVDVESCPVQP